MCGFVGFLGRGRQFNKGDSKAVLKCMADTIINRGPDDDGYWLDHEKGIGLGHRRLSIVDLSSAGHQPMHSASDRYVIAFNGEITMISVPLVSGSCTSTSNMTYIDEDGKIVALWSDGDEDGVNDIVDEFPFDETQSADLDGDGYGDNEEISEGTDPNDADDQPIQSGLPIWLLYEASKP